MHSFCLFVVVLGLPWWAQAFSSRDEGLLLLTVLEVLTVLAPRCRAQVRGRGFWELLHAGSLVVACGP